MQDANMSEARTKMVSSAVAAVQTTAAQFVGNFEYHGQEAELFKLANEISERILELRTIDLVASEQQESLSEIRQTT